MLRHHLGRAALASLVFLSALLGNQAAKAGLIATFDSRAAFDAAFPGLDIEDWEGFAAGTTLPNGSIFDGITYNSPAGNAAVTNVFLSSTFPNTLGRTGLNSIFFTAGDTMTFGFATPITVFGIDINTFATNNGAYQAVTNLGDVALSSFDPFPAFGTGQFVGFLLDTPVTSVTFGASSTNLSYNLDTMRFGNIVAVPEPASLILMGVGLVGLAGLSVTKRRRSKAVERSTA